MLSKVCLVLGVLVALSSAQEHVGSHCNTNRDCRGLPNTYCVKDWNSCNCKEGFIENMNWNGCVKKAKRLGDPCERNEQCEGLGKTSMSECEKNKCECQIGFMPNKDGTDCVEEPKKKIGEACSRSDQCLGDTMFGPGFAGCTSVGMCTCQQGYVPSTGLDRCLDVSWGMGATCVESHQCQINGGEKLDCKYSRERRESVCTCADDYTISLDGMEMECVPKAKAVGEECSIHEQCIANLKHSLCLNGTCQCMSPFTFSESTGTCGPKEETPQEPEPEQPEQQPEPAPEE